MPNRMYYKKAIARYKLAMNEDNKEDIIERIMEAKFLQDEDVPEKLMLPSFGKLRLVLEQEIKDERAEIGPTPSPTDIERLALKEAVYEYYMDLPYDIDENVVELNGSILLRRDNQKVDKGDLDFAPNKLEIYKRWMDKLGRYIREGYLSESKFDEAADRGIPQGGAFEKQLDRYRIDFMRRLWREF